MNPMATSMKTLDMHMKGPFGTSCE
jgi:hypothetical protein